MGMEYSSGFTLATFRLAKLGREYLSQCHTFFSLMSYVRTPKYCSDAPCIFTILFGRCLAPMGIAYRGYSSFHFPPLLSAV